MRYKTGEEDGVIQSDTRTLEMCIRAAELGNANAYANIGVHYRRGIAVEQNVSKAVAFYQVAAKKGSTKATQILLIIIGLIKGTFKCTSKI